MSEQARHVILSLVSATVRLGREVVAVAFAGAMFRSGRWIGTASAVAGVTLPREPGPPPVVAFSRLQRP